MNTDAILIAAIIIILVYLSILISLGFLLNQLCDRSKDWNHTRDELLDQAQTDKNQAQQVITRIQKQYGRYGKPYASERDLAIGSLSGVIETSQRVLADQGTRKPIKSVRVVSFWKSLFLVPLWREYRRRRKWWRETNILQVALAENVTKFQEVAHLEKELDSKGEKTKAAFVELQDKTARLIKAFETEARRPSQFQDQLQQLQAVDQEITKTLAENLAGQDVPAREVVTVHPKLVAFNGVWDTLAKDLAAHQHTRKETRKQIQKNKETIKRILALIALEVEAKRPTPTFQAEIKQEIAFLQDQEHLRQTGVYSEKPVKEQEKRLESLENRLTGLRNRRLTLVNYLKLSEEQIPRTEAWIELVPAPFVADKTNQLLDRVLQQRSTIHQLLQTTEDVDMLARAHFIDPQQLVMSRSKFDEKRKTYTSKHENLRQQVAAVTQRTLASIRNLRGQNPNYLTRFDPHKMDTKRISLANRWASTQTPAQIKESEIDLFISNCVQIESLVTDLNSICEQAEGISRTIHADRAKAQKTLEDPGFSELQQVMLQIAREQGSNSSVQAQDYAVKANQLTTEFDQAGPDYATIAEKAQRLSFNMDDLWRGYQRQYKNEKGKMESVIRQLTNLKTDLQKYHSHEISAFRGKTREQIVSIDTWLDKPTPTSLHPLQEHLGEGQALRKLAQDLLTNEISPEIRRYDQARRNAEKALVDARSAIDEVEKVLRNVPWGKKWEKQPYERHVVRIVERYEPSPSWHSALDHSYRLLDIAQDIFEEITSPEREYQSSAEKAIHDLDERVTQNAIKARSEADNLRQEVSEQYDEIRRESEELRKALSDGDQLARRLKDTGIRDQWYKKHQEYNYFDRELAAKESFREADRYLDHALVDVRYMLDRMRTFEES